jgi:hypothetical protein
LKYAVITLDVERDYGLDYINSRNLIDKILLDNSNWHPDIFGDTEVKVTTFVVGKIINETPNIIDSLLAYDVDLALHSFDHKLQSPSTDNISEGISIFRKYVRKTPLGYRAPQGLIKKEDLRILQEKGVKYDSTVFPFFRPFRYWNFSCPQAPYKIKDFELIEFPIASIPRIRLPFTLSYIMMLGFDVYLKMIKKFGLPEVLVFDLHLHDLFPSKAYTQLSYPLKVLYKKIYKNNPKKCLDKILSTLINEKYCFINMSELYVIFQENILKGKRD